MRGPTTFLLGAGLIVLTMSPALAETVMQQCGQQYQAAKAAGTLNGMTWGQYRTDCSARLKAQPASASAAPADVPATAPPMAAAPAATAPATMAPATMAPASAAAKAPASPGRVAMLARQRQCGAEWRSTKSTLVVQTPGLKWPQYWSQCNKRLKAAGQ